jgi:hypothetical protein
MHDHAVVTGLEPLDRGHSNRHDPASLADKHAPEGARRENFSRSPGCVTVSGQQWPCALDCATESLAAKRFHEEIEGPELECGDGEAVVGGRENHGRGVPQTSEHVDPGHAWQLNVEEDQIRLQFVDCGYRCPAVGRLPNAMKP